MLKTSKFRQIHYPLVARKMSKRQAWATLNLNKWNNLLYSKDWPHCEHTDTFFGFFSSSKQSCIRSWMYRLRAVMTQGSSCRMTLTSVSEPVHFVNTSARVRRGNRQWESELTENTGAITTPPSFGSLNWKRKGTVSSHASGPPKRPVTKLFGDKWSLIHMETA